MWSVAMECVGRSRSSIFQSWRQLYNADVKKRTQDTHPSVYSCYYKNVSTYYYYCFVKIKKKYTLSETVSRHLYRRTGVLHFSVLTFVFTGFFFFFFSKLKSLKRKLLIIFNVARFG